MSQITSLRKTRETRGPKVEAFGYEPSLAQSRWSSPVRAAVACVGLACLGMSRRSRGTLRGALAGVGTASLIRALVNRDVTSLVGWLANPLMCLERTIYVEASTDEVFSFLRNFDNYPQFMSYVRDVQVNDQGGLRWEVAAPGGLRLHWDAQVDQMVQNQVIGWVSGPGSLIHNRGLIELSEVIGGGTMLSIQLSYAPPVGAFGYAAIHLLGFDPKTRIDGDLEVMKMLIEKHSVRSA